MADSVIPELAPPNRMFRPSVVLTVAQKTRKHKLGTVTHSIDSAVLDDETLVASEEGLQGRDDLAKVRLVTGVVHGPLSVQDVVEGDKLLSLVHGTTADTAQLLHVAADTQQQTQVDAEGTDVGTSLAADPEDTEVAVVVKLDELALVDGSDTELALDGGDQGRALEQGTGESLERAGELGLAAGQLVVQANDGHILLTSSLLGLDKPGSTVNADNQASGDLGIKGTAVTSLLNAVFSRGTRG